MPYLVALTGPYSGQAFEVKPGQSTIGRGPGCDLVLDQDQAVSRAHALLVCAGGVVRVQDAGSTHGLYVNGRRVPQAILRTGDCVQLGGSCFQVQPVPAQVSEMPRLRVVLPPAARHATPDPGAADPGLPVLPPEPLVSTGTGCLLNLVAVLFPIPFGVMIGRAYLRKSHPVNQRFGAVCLILSLLSTLIQIGATAALVWYLLPRIRPLIDVLSTPGL